MTLPSNSRRNPQNGAYSYRTMDPEVHTVAELNHLPNVYGFRLLDKPNNSAGTITVSNTATGEPDFVQVTTVPNPGEVFIDFASGLCIFNIADDGAVAQVTYEGGGTVLTLETLGKDYLTTETNTFKVYDNKYVYRTVIEVPALPTANNNIDIGFSFAFSKIFRVGGTVTNGVKYQSIVIGEADHLSFEITAGNLKIINGNEDRSLWSGTYIIEYVK